MNVIDFSTRKPITRARLNLFASAVEDKYVVISFNEEDQEFDMMHNFRNEDKALDFLAEAIYCFDIDSVES